MRLQLWDPVADVEEAELTGQVEHQYGAHDVAEEGGGGAEALLAGRVPQLKVDAVGSAVRGRFVNL